MKKNLPKLIRAYLIFGAFYMLLESAIYFFNLRLSDVASIWPKSALTYSAWMSIFYASCSLFISLLLFYLQNNLEKNKQIIKLIALFSLFHGSLLLFASLTVRFDEIYQNFPSLSFFLPYNGFLLLESLLLYGFVLLVYFWQKS